MSVQKVLFRSNINQIIKISNKLRLSRTMQDTLVILDEENQKYLREAEQKLGEAVQLLYKITKGK